MKDELCVLICREKSIILAQVGFRNRRVGINEAWAPLDELLKLHNARHYFRTRSTMHKREPTWIRPTQPKPTASWDSFGGLPISAHEGNLPKYNTTTCTTRARASFFSLSAESPGPEHAANTSRHGLGNGKAVVDRDAPRRLA